MSITLSNNVESQYQTKHTNMQYYLIRKLINKIKLSKKYISSLKMLVDIIIKVLLLETF